jgi:hypothetical protein
MYLIVASAEKVGTTVYCKKHPRMRVMLKPEEEHDPESLKKFFPIKMVFARSSIVISAAIERGCLCVASTSRLHIYEH